MKHGLWDLVDSFFSSTLPCLLLPLRSFFCPWSLWLCPLSLRSSPPLLPWSDLLSFCCRHNCTAPQRNVSVVPIFDASSGTPTTLKYYSNLKKKLSTTVVLCIVISVKLQHIKTVHITRASGSQVRCECKLVSSPIRANFIHLHTDRQ